MARWTRTLWPDGPYDAARRSTNMASMNAAIDPGEGRQLIDRLGFLHVPGAPFAPPPAYLIVGIRPRPTLEHFDPQVIEYWHSFATRGMPATLDWMTRAPAVSTFSWGPIRIVDRLGIFNEFLGFGGSLETRRVDEVRVCVFRSDAPIVARGGHSQAREFESNEIAIFLARLRAAADPRGVLETRLAGMSPTEIYAAFVASRLATIGAGDRLADWRRADRLILLRERRRLRDQTPAAWSTGSDLACELGAGAGV